MVSERDWRSLVEQNTHSCDIQRAGGMLEHRPGLVQRNSREPLKEL